MEFKCLFFMKKSASLKGKSFKRRLAYFLLVNNNAEGINIPRTIKVSNNIPKAIVKPNKYNSCKGCVISTAKVDAKIIPAEEMTPPVIATPRFPASGYSELFFSFRILE